MSSFRRFRAANHAACARSRARCLANYNRIGPGTLEAADGPADAWVASRWGLSGPSPRRSSRSGAWLMRTPLMRRVRSLISPVRCWMRGDQPQGEDDGAGHTGGGGSRSGSSAAGPLHRVPAGWSCRGRRRLTQSPAGTVDGSSSSCSCGTRRGRPRRRRARATPIPARTATARKADWKPSVSAVSRSAPVFVAR